MKKNILILLSLFILTFGTMTCYAVPEETVTQEEVPEEESTETLTEETTEEEIVSEPVLPESIGEESIIQAINTKYSDTSNCQINLSALLPDNFGLSAYANILHVSTGQIYQLPLYSENNYFQKCFVPSGDYRVTEIAVYEDTTNEYPFTSIADFSLSSGNNINLETTLSNFDEIDALIREKRGEEIATAIEEEIECESDFEVEYTGSGNGLVGITGTQYNEYYIKVQITKGGYLGVANMQYSLDNGATWSETTTIPLSGKYVIPNTGLTLHFAVSILDREGFLEGDIYTSYIYDPDKTIEIEHSGSSALELEVTAIDIANKPYDLMKEHDAAIVIEVLKSGGLDEAVIRTSIDNGATFSEEKYAPTDGVIYFDEIGVKASFITTNGQYYLVEKDTYTAIPSSDNFIFLIISIIAVIVLIIVIIIYFFASFSAQKPSNSVYYVHKYNPVKVIKKVSKKK